MMQIRIMTLFSISTNSMHGVNDVEGKEAEQVSLYNNIQRNRNIVQ